MRFRPLARYRREVSDERRARRSCREPQDENPAGSGAPRAARAREQRNGAGLQTACGRRARTNSIALRVRDGTGRDRHIHERPGPERSPAGQRGTAGRPRAGWTGSERRLRVAAAPAPGAPAGPARGGAFTRSPYLSTPRRHGEAQRRGERRSGLGLPGGRGRDRAGERRPGAGAGLGGPADNAVMPLRPGVGAAPPGRSEHRRRENRPVPARPAVTGTPGFAIGPAAFAVPAPGACTCCRGARSAAGPLGAEVSLSG